MESKGFIGMSPKQLQQYSVTRVIRTGMRGGDVLDGIEGEMSREVETKHIQKKEGVCLVPFDVLFSRPARRDLSAETFGAGGALVATEVRPPVIELLRNRMVCRRLGCTVLDGLTGNVAIPRQTGAAVVQALPETGALNVSDQAIDQVTMTPHRIGCATQYSRQLVLQSSVSVEDFIRDDLLKQVAIKWDRMILEGKGSDSEPTGILNTTG